MKKCTTYTIGKTRIIRKIDTNPDTSYLGEYGNELKPGCIIRVNKTFFEDIPDDWNTSDIKDMSFIRGEYPYFYPPDNGELPGTADYKKYALQDYQNMEDLNNSQWGFIGIIIKTEIKTDIGFSNDVQSSLWGIEDHFDKDSQTEINQIIDELKSENKAELLEMGFSSEEIDQSLNGAEIKEW